MLIAATWKKITLSKFKPCSIAHTTNQGKCAPFSAFSLLFLPAAIANQRTFHSFSVVVPSQYPYFSKTLICSHLPQPPPQKNNFDTLSTHLENFDLLDCPLKPHKNFLHFSRVSFFSLVPVVLARALRQCRWAGGGSRGMLSRGRPCVCALVALRGLKGNIVRTRCFFLSRLVLFCFVLLLVCAAEKQNVRASVLGEILFFL